MIYYNSSINYQSWVARMWQLNLFICRRKYRSKYLVSNWSNYLPVKITATFTELTINAPTIFLVFIVSIFFAALLWQKLELFSIFILCFTSNNSRWIIISRFFGVSVQVSRACSIWKIGCGVPTDYAILIVSYCNLSSIFYNIILVWRPNKNVKYWVEIQISWCTSNFSSLLNLFEKQTLIFLISHSIVARIQRHEKIC